MPEPSPEIGRCTRSLGKRIVGGRIENFDSLARNSFAMRARAGERITVEAPAASSYILIHPLLLGEQSEGIPGIANSEL
jgi:hypothetical protein